MTIFDKFRKKKESKEEKDALIEEKETVLPSEKKKTLKKKDSEKNIGGGYRILVKPMITEKASFLGQSGQYVFEVARTANKIEIAKAIEKVYGVKPLKVNVAELSGKNVRYGKTMGKTKNRKKAIVTLPKEAKIEIYEGV